MHLEGIKVNYVQADGDDDDDDIMLGLNLVRLNINCEVLNNLHVHRFRVCLATPQATVHCHCHCSCHCGRLNIACVHSWTRQVQPFVYLICSIKISLGPTAHLLRSIFLHTKILWPINNGCILSMKFCICMKF